MKRLICVIMALVICLLFCSCSCNSTELLSLGKISYSDNGSELYYNDRTYIDYNNSNGKYRFDFENEELKELVTVRGVYLDKYYGNDTENPDFIVLERIGAFYVREDIVFDHNTELSVRESEQPFSFRISEVTTGNVIGNEDSEEHQFTKLCNFLAASEPYNCVGLEIIISESCGKLYLQDVYDSDYYEITDEFKEDLYLAGIIKKGLEK